ncbi:MAG: transcriptional regulator [Firmicutes bacterium ML8_F2]|jgi:CRP/FNR family transcriptional regulator, dissimilatory nitrate respiration regulator|nr:MAG: transcriptional regulator [Firmicutes bacterium ML8_F2]
MIELQNYLSALKNTSLFGSITEEDLKIIESSQYRIGKYEKEQIIYLQNEKCRSADIILSGKVSVKKISKEGNILSIHTFFSSDLLGANIIFSSSNTYPLTVVSEEKTVLFHMPGQLILRLCRNNNHFLVSFLGAVSDRTVILADKIKTISLKTIKEQITDYLKYEYHLQNSEVIKLTLSKKELAERFGVQRSSLGRELNKMRRDGLIEYDARTITLKGLKEQLS